MKFTMRIVTVAGLLTILGASFLSLMPNNTSTAYAAECENEPTFLGIKPWYHGLCSDDGKKVVIGQGANDLTTDVWHIVLNVISIGVVLAGYIAVGLVIWGGIKYMIAGGESGKVSAAKTTIQNALIGLLIALSANAIVTFIAGRLG